MSIFRKIFYLYFTLLLMLTEILKSNLVFLLSLKDGFLVKISQNY